MASDDLVSRGPPVQNPMLLLAFLLELSSAVWGYIYDHFISGWQTVPDITDRQRVLYRRRPGAVSREERCSSPRNTVP